MSRSGTALGNLRACVIVVVLAFHSVLAYLGSLPAAQEPFNTPPYRWRAFPIVDNARWFGFDLFCALQDVYLMTLMFFLSGLFVWASLARKGTGTFLCDRILRLGLPFAFVVGVLMPITMYATYRVTAVDPSVSAYWQHWVMLPFWPSGPPWFLWQLLALNMLAAALHRLAPHWGDALGRLSARPHLYLGCIVVASALAYVPLALLFTPWEWGEAGPFAVQLCRPLHYLVYFFAGVGVGAYGLDRGLLAPEGEFCRRWRRWLVAALASFVAWIGFTAWMINSGNEHAPLLLQVVVDLCYVLACASNCAFVLALFVRFAHWRWRPTDSLRDNAYGMYLNHYIAVVWLQYALLGLHLPAILKAAVVFGGTLSLSWSASVFLRSIPRRWRSLSARTA